MTTNNSWNSEDPAQVARGGTGIASATAFAAICGGTTSTSALQSIASVGSSSEVLTSNGAAALPTFQAAAGGGAWTFISTATASASATVNFTDLTSSFFMYMFVYENVAPASDSQQFLIRTSTNNGSSYDSGSSDYAWGGLLFVVGTGESDIHSTGQSFMRVAGNSQQQPGSGTNENIAGHVMLYNPSSTNYTRFNSMCTFFGVTPTLSAQFMGSARLSAADVDAIQFLFNSGNIATGTFKLYGLSAT